jgi:hypothetical protein
MFTAGVQLSVAVATPNSSSRRAEQSGEGSVRFMSDGIVSVGGVVSPVVVIAIVCAQEALPSPFVAVQVITVWPAG